MDFIGKSFLPCFFRLLQSQEVDKQDLAREEVYTALRTLAAEIKGPYFLGEELSLVDVAIMPWISIDYIIADHRRFKREDVDAKWKEYADHVDKRESLIKTKSVGANGVHGDAWLTSKFRMMTGTSRSMGAISGMKLKARLRKQLVRAEQFLEYLCINCVNVTWFLDKLQKVVSNMGAAQIGIRTCVAGTPCSATK
jgi:hypothetical protein